jgi:hypothetical protein
MCQKRNRYDFCCCGFSMGEVIRHIRYVLMHTALSRLSRLLRPRCRQGTSVDALAYLDSHLQHQVPINSSNTFSLCVSRKSSSFVTPPLDANLGHSTLPMQAAQYREPVQIHHDEHERYREKKTRGQRGKVFKVNIFILGNIESLTYFFLTRFITATLIGLRIIIQL